MFAVCDHGTFEHDPWHSFLLYHGSREMSSAFVSACKSMCHLVGDYVIIQSVNGICCMSQAFCLKDESGQMHSGCPGLV